MPFAGIRVVEFSHMVMGPACGMILADLGAEVIKIEPLAGDNMRHLLGSGAGFFAMFNRNKKSTALDLRSASGLEAAHKLIATADIVIENFKSGVMAGLGLDYATLSNRHERLVCLSVSMLNAAETDSAKSFGLLFDGDRNKHFCCLFCFRVGRFNFLALAECHVSFVYFNLTMQHVAPWPDHGPT